MVVWNSRHRGSWGTEEQLDGSFPFPVAPRTFLLAITAYLDCYEIEINGSSNFSLKVRDGLPISSITHLAIEAELTVREIHIPVENMPRNLRLSLGSGAKVGDLFNIRGQPTEDAKSFTINWQSGPAKLDDVLFQLNPRLDEGRIVRNSRLDDEMGTAESSTDVPFTPGTPFHLVVGVTSLGFETRLNDKEWCNFKHRQDIATAKTLFLEGDLQPTDISIDSAQINLPSAALNGTNFKSRGVRLQLIYPEVPLNSRITGGFEKGCLLLITGKFSSHPSKVQMAVQCGEGLEECDIALHYVVQWEVDGSPKVTLNSKEEDTWGQVVKAEVEEGLFPSSTFDLFIVRTEEGFRCYLDGQEHAHLPYRLEDSRPDHVTVTGDVEIQRLLLL